MTTALEQHLKDEAFRRVYAEEAFVVDITEAICAWMDQEGVSRAELARRLGTSRSAVTQLLSGRNVSVRKLASIVHALGGEPVFSIARRRDLRAGGPCPPGLRLLRGRDADGTLSAASYDFRETRSPAHMVAG
ncbi:MAG: helix-turn-helix transcriptional regulator [Alphaproteobacteria bacterium]|nr:helix-turn-helix transcriptional regulator [Alphaproteobacteria bacterium]